jgi:hypothetical protein
MQLVAAMYRDKMDGKDWKKGELGESFYYSIISND